MKPEIITNHISNLSIRERIQELLSKSTNVFVAAAFFNESELIRNILQSGIEVTLIISLRPPTSYYALKNILHKNRLSVRYMGKDFHSKIYVFSDEHGKIVSSIIGSSNLTSGGLDSNIETNVVLKDAHSCEQVAELIKDLQEMSEILQPDVLNDYKSIYDAFVKKNPAEKNPAQNRTNKGKQKVKISREASQYYNFWKVADKVKELVGDISKKEYPNVPKYLAIDHFCH